MKKKLITAVVFIIVFISVFFAWRVAYASRKSNDNLPSLARIAEMDEADLNSILPGYRISQLREVWGEPDQRDENEDIWQIDDKELIVNYKNNGKVAICGLKAKSTMAYKVEIANEYPIENSLKNTYKAGEKVSIKLSTITEHYYIVYVNGTEQPMDASDLTYTYYTFIMPNEDVLIEIEDVSVDIPEMITGEFNEE